MTKFCYGQTERHTDKQTHEDKTEYPLHSGRGYNNKMERLLVIQKQLVYQSLYMNYNIVYTYTICCNQYKYVKIVERKSYLMFRYVKGFFIINSIYQIFLSLRYFLKRFENNFIFDLSFRQLNVS